MGRHYSQFVFETFKMGIFVEEDFLICSSRQLDDGDGSGSVVCYFEAIGSAD